VKTKGVSNILQEIKKTGGESLIIPPFFISGIELLSLMIMGKVFANFDDYNSLNNEK